ncbi:MAG: hypothetical protein AUJ52_04535 [Elusimicrobia bacterium CG1_02_63_36]|nr:MAG: hypothetical protein AUJ52_04535 [Elusimicrobia bacterium CG1_02_63_36]PIP81649.1 MAG: haloacid dehalogenase [Elusimicrobia bacterium CG22_combo_CG10-13_8_21_14_all_63_91]PJA14216.1 MAG: haloacid dehalogenase [Elusimicrobia bacterium CG_4_10_14_0_2_um_filter_63_34]PJB24595.1 MAG: haloacid dehalogenase [Elusimicrobia bacterium CG_4_9_14_3_um_filter_62_55]
MNLTDFEALSFDCYGTLIDWETGIASELEPWLARAGREAGREEILSAFGEAELAREREDPAALYPEILKRTFLDLARRFEISEDEQEAERFGASVGRWPAFDDTARSLVELKRRFKLFLISNVDRASFAQTAVRLGVEFDGVFTAEEIGSYKPDPRNFAFLVNRLEEHGIERGKILHTAQSMTHDILPARAAGLKTAWIHRRFGRSGWGATAPPPASQEPDFMFTSLTAMASAL